MNPLFINKEGCFFTCKIYNRPIEGKVHIEDNEVFLCQNTYDGQRCYDTLGYSFSWTVQDGNNLRSYDVTDLRFLNILSYDPTEVEVAMTKEFVKAQELIATMRNYSVSEETLRLSLEEELLSFDTTEFGVAHNRIYDEEKYHSTYSGLLLNEETFKCENCGKYFSEDDEIEVHDDGKTFSCCSKCVTIYYHYNDEYFTYEGLDYNDLVIMPDGEIRHKYDDDIYYWDSDGDWHYEEESLGYVKPYHSGNSYPYDLNGAMDKTPFRIGYEIEKEDEYAQTCVDINEFEQRCKGWRKEEDGSLGDCGFEAISPILPLNVKEIEKYLRGNDLLLTHINADYSSCCGGHINISHKGKNGDKFFDMIKGYVPLLYALYPSRVKGSYCRGMKVSELKRYKDRHNAVRIGSDRLEIRIFPAARNIENIIWRTKLIRLMLNHPARTPEKAYEYLTKYFQKLMREVYKGDFDTKFSNLRNRFKKYTLDFEGKQLNN